MPTLPMHHAVAESNLQEETIGGLPRCTMEEMSPHDLAALVAHLYVEKPAGSPIANRVHDAFAALRPPLPVQEVMLLGRSGTLLDPASPIPESFSAAGHEIIEKIRVDAEMWAPPAGVAVWHREMEVVEAVMAEFAQEWQPEGPRCTTVISAWLAEHQVPLSVNELRSAVAEALAAALKHAQDQLGMTVEEAVVNAIRHGNLCIPTLQVTVRHGMTADGVYMTAVSDQGSGFDPDQVPDPTTPERLTQPTGRGLLYMRSFLDGVEFNEKGNSVVLMKDFGKVIRKILDEHLASIDPGCGQEAAIGEPIRVTAKSR